MFEAIDYFPTPNNLAEIMAKSVAKKTKRYTFAPGPILEPSAESHQEISRKEHKSGFPRVHEEIWVGHSR